MLSIEPLEDRTLLSIITWNNTAAQSANGGDWDTGSNWVGNVAPGPTDTAVINGLTGSGKVYLDSNYANSISGLTTDSTVNLDVINGSLSLGNASLASVDGSITIGNGAALNVGPLSSVLIGSNQTITVNGSLGFATGDSVAFKGAATIAINNGGTLTAAGDTFSVPNGSGGNSIQVYSGGELTAGTSTFDLNQVSLAQGSVLTSTDLEGDTFNGVLSGQTFSTPLSVPYGDVQYLGSNAAFGDIDILSDTIPSGSSLSLQQIGGGSALRHVFPVGSQPFTVALGATLSVANDVSVLIATYQTITDDGSLSFGKGDTVAFDGAATIGVNNGGTMTAAGDTFAVPNGSGGNSIQVYSGGELTAGTSTFDLNQVSLAQGSVLTSTDLEGDTFSGVLSGQTFNTPLSVPYGDVQYVGSNAAFGDIDILSDTIPSGSSLSLQQIGGGSALRVCLPGGLSAIHGGVGGDAQCRGRRQCPDRHLPDDHRRRVAELRQGRHGGVRRRRHDRCQ